MSPKESVTSVLRHYATFSGRASRSEYWWFHLALGLSFVLVIVPPILIGILIYVVIVLGSIIPSVAVSARRLHDSNKSGWYQLIGLVPFIGGIALIVLFAMPSYKGENKFGSL